MPHATSPAVSPRTFAIALFAGLAWGIAGAAFVTAVAMTVDEVIAGRFSDPTQALRLILEAAGWAGVVASALAVFPIGPIAGIAGWQLYRRGVVSPWAYAGVGALAAAVTPVLVLVAAAQSMRYATPKNYAVVDEGMVPVFVAAFAVIGAFSGFTAGRMIRRAGVPAS